jgi:hypothetical protein
VRRLWRVLPLLIGMLGAAWSPLISTQAGGAGASARTTVRGGIVIHWRIVEPPGPSGWDARFPGLAMLEGATPAFDLEAYVSTRATRYLLKSPSPLGG